MESTEQDQRTRRSFCAGSVATILQRAARALDESCEDLPCHIRAAAALNIDETG